MIAAASITNCGGRKENEDTVRIKQNGNHICVVTADGLGGHGGGQIASQTVADVIMNYDSQDGLDSNIKITEAFALADKAVKKKQTTFCEMKSTAAVLRIEDQTAYWAHVGDTRIYYFENTKLRKQTLDHSVSQMAVLMNEITQEQIRFHADRSRILRALGSDSYEPEIDWQELQNGKFHAFLLCTDGFWEYVYENEMEQFLESAKTPEAWLANMEELLKKRVQKENDNYSAVAVFVL